jgi:hypothetical protein
MHKRGGWALLVSVILVIVLVLILFLYMSLVRPNYNTQYTEKESLGEITNPASNLSIEEGVVQFNEGFVFYLLYSIKAYNLHNPPLSSDVPKIEFYIGGDVYHAFIEKGIINVEKGKTDEKDIIIRTSKEDAVKMVKDQGYIKESFSSGKSSIELVSSKSVLFQKGYLNLYTELTGKSITSNVVKIYSG